MRLAGAVSRLSPGRSMCGLAQKLKLLDWNKRVLTEADLFRLCEDEGVLFLELRMKWKGLYVVRRRRPVIVVSDALGAVRHAIVSWHEMGHHLLHSPDARFFCDGSVDKAEYQAHVIAACALIPETLMHQKRYQEIQEEYGYPDDLMWFRLRIFNQLGL